MALAAHLPPTSTAADRPMVPVPPAAPASARLARELAAICPVSQDDLDRIACARDMWPRWLVFAREGRWPKPPDLVVSPASSAEVGGVLRACGKAGVPVVPYGAGSGVCGAALCAEGGVALDLKRLSAVRRVDADRRRVEVEAGHLGWTLEEKLGRAGFTAGHFPSSMSCSTVGGWVAARGAGQLSTRYGKIEDLCLGVEAVLASGEVLRCEADQDPFVELLCGSEGTLAVLTAATLRLRPSPERRRFLAFRFAGIEEGIASLRGMLRAGLRPAVVRLYDPLDTLIAAGGGKEHGAKWTPARRFGLPPGFEKRLGLRALGLALRSPGWIGAAVDRVARSGCRLVLCFEGSPDVCDAEALGCEERARAGGGRPEGPGPAEHWWAHRYEVSFKQMPVFEAGLWVDTMELSATWDQIIPLYRRVRQALGQHALCMAHFSHAYPDGCSVYLTFAGGGESADEAAERHRRAWADALEAALALGVSVSHHHGVGLAKADAYRRQLGDGGLTLFAAVKRTLDPKGLLNPGKIAPRELPRPLAVGAAPLGDAPRSLEELAAAQRALYAEGVGTRGKAAARQRLDRSGLTQVAPIDERTLAVEASAGVRIGGLESRLRAHRLTLGPLPPSVLAGTVADWLEGPLRGLRATLDGRLEPAALSVVAVLPNGAIFRTTDVPRSAAGPGLEALIYGGGGSCGLVASAKLRVEPVPEQRSRRVFTAPGILPLLGLLRRSLDRDSIPRAAGLFGDGRRRCLALELAGPSGSVEAMSRVWDDGARALGIGKGAADLGDGWWQERSAHVGREVQIAWEALPELQAGWRGPIELYRLTHEGALAVGEAPRPAAGKRRRAGGGAVGPKLLGAIALELRRGGAR
ncbi:MAG: FAD-binding oxidoreductase [Deltaproteobacteria bacterium]